MRKYLFMILALMVAVPVMAADQWDKLEIKSATEINNYDVVIPTNNEAIDRLLTNYRQGVKIIYSSAAAVKVEDGEIVCSNSGGTIRRFRKNTTALTTVDFDNNLDTGLEAASTKYYVYAVADTDIEGFTFKISEDAVSPDGATYFKKLGSFYNDSDSDITLITNDNTTQTISTGTVDNAGTIALPSGYVNSECTPIISINDFGPTGASSEGYRHQLSVTSARVVTATSWNSTYGTTSSETANYAIVCFR